MRAPEAGSGVLHPVALVALAGLLANDHVLKAAAAGTSWTTLTGKLSDVCGVAFLPVLLVAVIELVQRARGRGAVVDVGVAVAVAVVVAVAFAAMKTWAPAGACYATALGALQWPVYALRAALHGAALPPLVPVRHVVDASDVVAVPAAFFVVWLQRRRVALLPARA